MQLVKQEKKPRQKIQQEREPRLRSVLHWLKKKKLLSYTALIAVTLVMIFPYIWMMLSALKKKQDMFTGGLIPAEPQWDSFRQVLFDTPMVSYIVNSIGVSAVIVAIQLTGAVLAAYVFARIQKKWVGAVFVVIMAMYMLPAAATYVPSYILISNAGLLDSQTGFIISEVLSIFSIFFLRQTFLQIPEDIVEAARLDGAGHLRLLGQLYVPYCKNALASLVLINFIYSYNNYMWPSLLIKSEEKMLATVGLRRLFMQQAGYGTDWPMTMAACAITVMPMLLLLMIGNKKIIRSMSGLFVNK